MEALKKQKDEEVQREVEVQKEALLKMQTESEGNYIQWEEEEEVEGKGTQVLHITYLCEFFFFFFWASPQKMSKNICGETQQTGHPACQHVSLVSHA